MQRITRLFAVIIVHLMLIFAPAQSQDLYRLPSADAPLSVGGTLDITNNGRVLLASNMLNNTVSLVSVNDRSLQAEISVGNDPRGVSFSPDDRQALVVNRGDNTLSVIDVASRQVTATYPVGILPYSVVTNHERIAWVSSQATDEVIQIDYQTGEIIARIPTRPTPTGLTLWGDGLLYVTHLWTGEISLIHVPQMQVVRVTNSDASMGLSFSLAIVRTTGTLYAPQTRTNDHLPSLTFDSALSPMLNTFSLQSLHIAPNSRYSVDVADRPVNMPFSVAVDPARNLAYVVNAGTDDVSVIDLASGIAVANIAVGVNPRAGLLNNDGTLLFVHNVLEGSISIIDTRAQTLRDNVPISDLRVPIGRLLGAEYFHSARIPEMGARTLSCASCHFDGLSDGRVWNLNAQARMNTPILFDLEHTAPYTWRGEWDEVADVELKIRSLQFGEGLLDHEPNPPLGDFHGGLSPDLDLLASYLVTIDGPSAPPPLDAQQAQLGAELFASLNCTSCHSGESFQDGLTHDIGTGGEINTPTLNWLWMSAPYFHDGRAGTLRDVFMLPSSHQLVTQLTPDEIEALTAYLLTLPE
jgi:YVTN family beta-propeller protein